MYDKTRFDVSVMLKQQLDAVLSLQKLMLAMHETLKERDKGFESVCTEKLQHQADPNQAWVALAKKTFDDFGRS